MADYRDWSPPTEEELKYERNRIEVERKGYKGWHSRSHVSFSARPELWECPTCFALVRMERVPGHEGWHGACVCNVGVQECPIHPGRLRSKEEKIAFRKAWDARVK